MTLIKYRIGDLVEQNIERNEKFIYGVKDVKGMTISKMIIPTKAKIDKNELTKFWIVGPNEFIYNPRTHGEKIGLGYNDTPNTFIISWNNTAFHIKEGVKKLIDPTYLFIYFNRLEWDRNATFNSWGSSTEVFSWDTFCSMELDLPDVYIQKKYVAIYKAMQHNLAVYQSKLDDLKLVCDGYIEDLRGKLPNEQIGQYFQRRDERNYDNAISNVKGISVYKCFREPTSKVNRNELKGYKIVKPNDIAFVQTTHNEKVFAFAHNNTKEDMLVSSVNEVIWTDEKILLPEYLSIFLMRKEFDRYARFHSWGSAREIFSLDNLREVKIPIPDIKLQESIVAVHNSYQKRKEIVEKLKIQINNICPILIAGAIKEGIKNG